MKHLEKTDHTHKAIKKAWNGYQSACGWNSADIKNNHGQWVTIYGGAKRTTKNERVTCPDCKKLLASVTE